MKKSEIDKECVKHNGCKTCKYREWKTYGEWGCSIKNEDVEQD